MSKKRYSVVVEVVVEAESLSDANYIVENYFEYDESNFPPASNPISSINVVRDWETHNANQRVYYFHPEDTHRDYDPSEYEKELEKDRMSEYAIKRVNDEQTASDLIDWLYFNKY
jgi:hypothetical protein